MKKLTPQVLALYLGQKCETKTGDSIIVGVNRAGVVEIRRISDGVFLTWWVDDIKPILRPLSSLTENEARELYELKNGESFDDESCLHWWSKDKDEWYTTESKFCVGFPLVWLKLLSIGFDLFGLIDNGLALDATKMEVEKTV